MPPEFPLEFGEFVRSALNTGHTSCKDADNRLVSHSFDGEDVEGYRYAEDPAWGTGVTR